MSTTAIAGATLAPQTTSDRGMDSLRSEDFFRILVTELQNQDPLQPTETSDMIGQVSDIRNIEVSKQLTDVLSQMARQQRTGGASDLIGKHITAMIEAEDGMQYVVAGIVTGVRFDPSGAALLELDTGEYVPVSEVTHVTSAEVAELRAKAAESAGDTESTEKAETSKPTGPLTWLGHVLGL